MTSSFLKALFMAILMLTATAASYSSTEKQFNIPQPHSIQQIYDSEKSSTSREKITDIVNRIDQTYANLYDNLTMGNKLVIFFDPAHGKLPDGRWQGGDATRRTSCTGLPEEHYSILLSRKMYDLLNRNKFIEIRSTDDYMAVLRGLSDSYRDISFTRTVELADRAGAFLIISEHLNNISVLYKADGRVNLPGIHVTRNGYGRKMLQFVRDTYDGFLTLYNKVDASGFSRNYALKLNNTLVSKGLKPNNWQFGAVGDTRFSYFIDFPMSVIYESGFISNPEEEKNLRDPEFTGKIVESQYSALLETIKEIFAVDISGPFAQKAGEPSPERIELLKLARLAIYYIQAVDTNRAVRVIREMEKKYAGSRYGEYTQFFTRMKTNLVNSSRHFNIAAKYKRHKKNRLARRHYSLARRYLLRAPIFAKMHERYRNELNMTAPESNAKTAKPIKITPLNTAVATDVVVRRAPVGRSIIFPVEQNQSLEKAIEMALAPDAETLTKLVRSFKNARTTASKKVRVYSPKKKKHIVRWKETTRRVQFVSGIYIVRLDKKLNVISACYKNSVTLNPNQYQNQQYLKNSCFAHDTKERTL